MKVKKIRCNRCGLLKPENEFSPASLKKVGVNHYCADCRDILYGDTDEMRYIVRQKDGTDITVLGKFNRHNGMIEFRDIPKPITDMRLPSRQDNATCEWIYAYSIKDGYPKHTEYGGKWLIFADTKFIDSVWIKIRDAVTNGVLGYSAKVSDYFQMSLSMHSRQNNHVICVYTYDYRDTVDVWRIRNELRNLGITWVIPYKTDEATIAGRYMYNTGESVSIYRG